MIIIIKIIVPIVIFYVLYNFYKLYCNYFDILENLNKHIKLKNTLMEFKVYDIDIKNYDDFGNIKRKKFLE